MKNVVTVFAGLFSLFVAVIAALYSVRWIVRKLTDFLQTLDPELYPAIISAIAVITVAIVTFIMQRYLERLRLREASLRAEKRTAYESLLATMLSSFGLEASHLAGDDLVKSMNANIRPLLLNASNDVLKSWREFTKMSASIVDGENPTPQESKKQLIAFERIIKSIRKDLGHPTGSLNEGDLISVIVRDFSAFK